MGNASSKHSSKRKPTNDEHGPAFTRTDTGTSVKSSRSLKSIRSRRSQSSSVPGTPKISATDPPSSSSSTRKNSSNHLNVPPSLSRHGSSNDILPEGTTAHAGQDSPIQRTPRSSSTNGDLPPSMVQMEPKSPILRNSAPSGNVSTQNTTYHENALTDDDNDDYEASSNHHHRRSNESSGNRRHSSARSSSVGSRGHNASGRRKSNSSGNHLDLPDGAPSQQMSRTSSHTSSLVSQGNHSRKSSFSSTSGGNTAYSTPMTSPGLLRNHHEQNDYFGDTNNNELGDGEGTFDVNQHVSDGGLDEYPRNLPPDTDENSTTLLPSAVPGAKKKRAIKPIDIEETIQKLLDAGYSAKRTKNVCLKNSEIAQICHQAREIFLSQPSLLELSPPVKIVGDVHGQYADLLRLFTKCGFPPAANYLFLGDYVDRGKQSLETILLLLCYKIKYPENFFLLRGNHECANVTRVYGFYDECKRRCNIKTWKLFIDTFNTLPLAAIVAGKIFCVHGGLSPVLNSMDEIRHVSRPTDVPDFGLINDLLWSDPTDSPNEWEDNERGVSYCYNKVAINKFLNKFGFDLVCRAHMVVEDGYEFFNDRSLVTVFSAPNYCGEFDNWGAVMSVSEGLLCSFELLDPLDSTALKQVMKKGRQERKLANQQQLQEL